MISAKFARARKECFMNLEKLITSKENLLGNHKIKKRLGIIDFHKKGRVEIVDFLC